MTGEPLGAPPMSDRVARPEIGMVVLQPTAFCNINCSYCYLPDRSNKHVMAQTTVTRLFSEVFASLRVSPSFAITAFVHVSASAACPRLRMTKSSA